MKKNVWIYAVLFLVLLLSACGGQKNVYGTETPVSTHWFDFVVEEVELGYAYADYQAPKDKKLVICSLTLENTFGEDLPMGWMDFVLTWRGEENGVYPLTTISQEQLPEVYHLKAGERIDGQLVFEIPKKASRPLLVFQERYAAEGSEGDYKEGVSYRVALD